MATYPAGLPAPLMADYTTQTLTGLASVQFERGNSRRRRTAYRDRHVFTLSFVFSTQQLWTWQAWANQFGYDWHSMQLESAYSGLSGGGLVPHQIRYISDISLAPAGVGYLRASVMAELDVTTLPSETITSTGNWYVSGSPASPSSPDRVLAGTPASPSAHTITAGTPASPAA